MLSPPSVLSAAVTAAWLPSLRGAPRAPWTRDGQEGGGTRAEVRVPIAAPDLARRLRDVEAWPSLFPELLAVTVEREDGDRVRALVTTRGFGGPHAYDVEFVSPLHVELRLDVPGLRASASILVSVDTESSSCVVMLLLVQARALAPVVSEADERHGRARVVGRYLADFERTLGAQAPDPTEPPRRVAVGAC